jgi:hypothetical protein
LKLLLVELPEFNGRESRRYTEYCGVAPFFLWRERPDRVRPVCIDVLPCPRPDAIANVQRGSGSFVAQCYADRADVGRVGVQIQLGEFATLIAHNNWAVIEGNAPGRLICGDCGGKCAPSSNRDADINRSHDANSVTARRRLSPKRPATPLNAGHRIIIIKRDHGSRFGMSSTASGHSVNSIALQAGRKPSLA